MAKRQTFNVKAFREAQNLAILRSKDIDPSNPQGTPAYRLGLYLSLEAVLHESGNYNGFRFLDGYEAVQRGEYDDTARHYH